MSDKLVSFIIPAYNAADTIVRCLESIYGLSLKREEFEVIVIDDCSIDETVSIIEDRRLKESFESNRDKKNENLILLKQQENHRQGAARNRGVKEARGEYICFVDADDVVTEGVVTAIRLANEKKTDLLAFHVAHANEQGEITREEEHLQQGPDEVFTGLDLKHPYWYSGPVAYIYNREYLGKVKYPFAEDVLYEDADFVSAHVYYAQRMAYSLELGYIAYYRSGSTTRSITHRNISDFLLLGIRMLKLYERMTSENPHLSAEAAQFAESILDGACRNMWSPAKRIIKLDNINEVRAFYNRIDERVDRAEIAQDKRLHKYYWNIWTTIVIQHKNATIMMMMVIIPMYKMLYKLVKRK